MASIIFLMDLYPGHILPSFGLADELISQGHQVTYIGVADNQSMVRSRGFQYEVIFEEVYPRGYITRASEKDYAHFVPILSGALDPVLAKLGPDLIITSFFLVLEGLLVYHKYHIPQLLFNPHLRDPDNSAARLCENRILELPGTIIDELITNIGRQNIPIGSINEFIGPARHFPELVACPREFDLPENQYPAHVQYIGPCIRSDDRGIKQWTLPVFPSDKKIIYASMGSSSGVGKEKSEAFFRRMIAFMRLDTASSWHMILATGEGVDPATLPEVSGNVTLLQWAPQLEVLSRADLAMIHGGLGTIKECIYYGVPMIVFPRTKEMMQNAIRVRRHRLGEIAEIEATTPEQLLSMVTTMMDNPSIKQQIETMKAIFREKAENQAGGKVVGHYLKTRSVAEL